MNLRYFAWRRQTELGAVTHNYWHEGETYFRQPLSGGVTEVWNGSDWVLVEAAKLAA